MTGFKLLEAGREEQYGGDLQISLEPPGTHCKPGSVLAQR